MAALVETNPNHQYLTTQLGDSTAIVLSPGSYISSADWNTFQKNICNSQSPRLKPKDLNVTVAFPPGATMGVARCSCPFSYHQIHFVVLNLRCNFCKVQILSKYYHANKLNQRLTLKSWHLAKSHSYTQNTFSRYDSFPPEHLRDPEAPWKHVFISVVVAKSLQ